MTGRARRLGHQRSVDRVLADLELGSETATHVVADDPDVRQGQSHCPRQALLDAVDALGGVPDGEPVAIPFGHRAVRFHGRVDLTLRPVGALDHHLGLGETGGEVAALAHRRFPDDVATLVDCRRGWFEGGLVIDHKRQHLVLDLNRPDGVYGLQRRLRGDDGDFLAFVAAAGVEELAGEFATTRIPGHIRPRRFAGQHRKDARHFFRLAGVDLQNIGVGMRAAQDRAVQHLRQGDIVGVDCSPTDAFIGVDPRYPCSNDRGLLPGIRIFARARCLGDRSIDPIGRFLIHHWPPFLFSAAVVTAFTMCG